MTNNSPVAASRAALSPTFLILAVLFCVFLIASNLIELKTIRIGPLTSTAGVIVFPVSYIIADCLVEVYGFAKARLVIWLGFLMNMLVTVILQLAIWLPGDASWLAQDAMSTIFGAAPRICAASFAAFLCGSMVNAYVMSRMKAHSDHGKGFSLRAIISTVFGEGVDSLIFFPAAFFGILPLDVIGALIITQICIKTVYEILILPVTLRVVRRLRLIEGGDVTDRNISYKWWKLNEL